MGGVVVQGDSSPVVAHGDAQISCNIADLGGGDERVPHGMEADRLGVSSPPGDPTDEASRAVPVEAASVGGGEGRPGGSFADGQVHAQGGARRQGDSSGLAALAQHREGPMPPLQAKGLDKGRAMQVGADATLRRS